MSDYARQEILARIRGAVASAPAIQRPLLPPGPLRQREEIVDQFVEFAAEYKAKVRRIRGEELAQAIFDTLKEYGARRVVIPVDLPPFWISDGLEVTPDVDLDYSDLDHMDAVITGCAVAIAETGTVVLDAGHAQGRRAITLIPDHHVCVIFEEQIVESVPEAVDELRGAVMNGQPLTWISGPSATSDIELSRVEGVHGPRKLAILIVANADANEAAK